MENFDGVEIFLKQFRPLIYKTLSRLNIFSRQMDYEDYFQELQIKLIDLLAHFKNDSGDWEEMNAKFIAYAGQGLYWYGLDLIRNKSKNSLKTMEASSLEIVLDGDYQSIDDLESSLFTEDFLRLAKRRLSVRDFDFLLRLIKSQSTMQELADDYGVARDTLYQWKKRLRMRLVDIKDCIQD